MPASSDCAPASRRRRVSGSENAAIRCSYGSAKTSRHPGSPSRMAPCEKLSRICMVCGSVSATTVAPRSAAAVPAASWLQAPSGFMDDTPSTFQFTGRSASRDMVAMKSISSSVNPLRQPATMSSTVVPSCDAHGGGEALHLGAAGGPRRHGLAVPVVVRVHLRGREAERTVLERGVQRRLHGVDVRVGRGAADRPVAHDEAAQRRVADEEAGVDRDTAVEAAEPIAERAPVPRQAVLQGGERHALDPRHHPADVVGAVRPEGCQREAAVPAEHGGHAVQRGGAGVGVPEQLGVVVGVQVDEAGRDQQAAGVDDRVGLGRRAVVRRDGDHAVALDEDVGPDGRRTGAVDHRPAADRCRHVPPLARRPARRPAPLVAATHATRWRAKACMPSVPSSTPKPDCFHPPIGAYMSRDEMPCVFTNTVPADQARGHAPPPAPRRCSTPRRTGRSRCRSPPATASSMSS